MSIINKILEIYDKITKESDWKLHGSEAVEYFERLMMNGNIITYIKDGELIGFLEFWRVSYEQFGRICCNISLGHEEDLLNGNICIITRMYIVPDLRGGEVFINLGKSLLMKNKDCSYFTAQQPRKNQKSLQVYTREEVLKHYKI